MGKGEKGTLRKISEPGGKSHADIVEANPHADTIKIRTQVNGKPGTRTYELSTTHGLSPERVSKDAEMKEARERGESERHQHIRIKTRQTEIDEKRQAKEEEEGRRAYREHERKQMEMIQRRESSGERERY